MAKNTNITELDLFNFIFFNELLPQKKRKYIERNEDKFELLDFYREQKKSIARSINKETQKKLAAKIPAYKISKK
ncbi:MAG: hypothetical protein WBH40_00560 [Ignavibacteriaceae bacterium]